jgi:gliding motility-associated-like protein
MFKKFCRLVLVIAILFHIKNAFSQQDVEFHLNAKLLPGKKILKVKRDFYDPYLWVLAQNNEVFRINSLTLAIDDYTAIFAAYSNLQFTDIAGRSQDTVFIATNSPNFIHYKKGAIRLVGKNDGITDIVNSVGIAGGISFNAHKTAATVMIATNAGFFFYNSDTETLTNKKFNDLDSASYSKIYQANYRTQMYRDSSLGTSDYFTRVDSLVYQPAAFLPDNIGVYVGYLWEGGQSFGYNINTAETIYQTIYAFNAVFSNFFWGNDRGMFQVNWYYSASPEAESYGHYLNGIKVNKIENIYGLTSLGNGSNPNTPIKQNLLIGTDKGFYFSSSVYQQTYYALKTFSLFHDDALGNIVINDICVNAASIDAPICEDGVWLAADDGLYLIKPDYAKYFNSQNIKAISFQKLADTISAIKICAGDSIKAAINTNNYIGNSIQWFKNGLELALQIKDTITINSTGDYYAVLYDPCENIHLESNHLKVTVITGPVFSFNYPDKIQHCNNTPDTLKTDFNPGYHYRWYTNGTLNGDTTSQYIVSRTGKYKVELSACTNSWVSSKEIEVDLVTLPVPHIAVSKSNYCAGDTASLSVDIPADTSYTINWYRNGIRLSVNSNLVSIKDTTSGSYTVTVNSNISSCTQSSMPALIAFTPSPVFTFNYPAELQYCKGTPVTLRAVGSLIYQYRWYKDDVLTGDLSAALSITQPGKYKVEVSGCPGSWVPSKEVQVNLIQLPAPVIAADKTAYCIGDNAIFSINTLPNPLYTINWYKDNAQLTANVNKTTLMTNAAGGYSVSLINNIANSDGTTCSQISIVQPLSFNPPPAVSIAEIVKTTLCEGQTVDLVAHYTGGSIKWSTGETSDHITVTKSGNYKLTVTSPAGCQADTSISISFLPDPVFTVKDTSICTYKRQSIVLTAPSGFSQYAWNGETGLQTYQVSQPQKLSLTVTDANGCQATQEINIVEQCPDIYIPNTFTPNQDGINDTWGIGGLENDQTAMVNVYNRYGTKIFESRGYSVPWNGKYGNKKIAAGVYYYIITAKNGTQKFSGSVTIIY